MQVPAQRLLPDASARASRRSTCAASPAAATATTPARCPASACTSTSSRSPPSRARSTCTSTTSPASRRWPARRARCTAPARRPARCASSPTSPIPSGFAAGYGLEVNTVDNGGIGHVLEGFVNVPLGDSAAIRLVGWNKHDAGYIDNKPGDRQFPVRSATVRTTRRLGVLTNRDCTSTDLLVCTAAPRTTTTTSTPPARALALKVDLNDNWSITPDDHGPERTRPTAASPTTSVGDLAVTHFYPEHSDDRWWQAALTVEGKIGNFDLTYAYAHLKRDVDVESDYNDYSLLVRHAVRLRRLLVRRQRRPDQPVAVHPGRGRATRRTATSCASPRRRTKRFRFVGGLFWQDQNHDIQQRYKIDGLGAQYSITGWPDTHLADQAGARGPRRGGVRRDLLRLHRQADRHRRRRATSAPRTACKGFFGFSRLAGSPVAPYGEAICADAVRRRPGQLAVVQRRALPGLRQDRRRKPATSARPT